MMDFLSQADELLMLVEKVLEAGVVLDQPFPLLAVEENDLSVVRGAFDIAVLHPDDLATTDLSDELVEAAELLQQAVMVVRGNDQSSSFMIDVGLDGSIGGTLKCRVAEDAGRVGFSFGYHGEPTNGPPVKQILDALEGHAKDLLTIYYESGHTVVRSGIYKRSQRAAPFPNWNFEDFSGFEITREKPPGDSAQKIHDAIGEDDDSSIFGWVAQRYSTGWLICDDGTGEVADFLHIDAVSGELSVIHVKAANSGSIHREIAVGPYEVVASQASKNFRYLAEGDLQARLSIPSVDRPACWTDGVRVDGRQEFLEALAVRSVTDLTRIVIVQPHVSEQLYSKVHSDMGRQEGATRSTLRLALLETLLNSARASVVGLGADLYVMGSRN
jgi:hypothetical protein